MRVQWGADTLTLSLTRFHHEARRGPRGPHGVSCHTHGAQGLGSASPSLSLHLRDGQGACTPGRLCPGWDPREEKCPKPSKRSHLRLRKPGGSCEPGALCTESPAGGAVLPQLRSRGRGGDSVLALDRPGLCTQLCAHRGSPGPWNKQRSRRRKEREGLGGLLGPGPRRGGPRTPGVGRGSVQTGVGSHLDGWRIAREPSGLPGSP